MTSTPGPATRVVAGLCAWLLAVIGAFSIGLRGGGRTADAGGVTEAPAEASNVVVPAESAASAESIQAAPEPVPPLAGIFSERVGTRRRLLLEQMLEHADEPTIKALLVEAEALTPGYRRHEILDALYRRWGVVAPGHAIEAVDLLRASDQRRRRAQVMEGWAGADPEAAFDGLLAYRRENPFESGMDFRLVDAFQAPLLERGEYAQLAAFAGEFSDREWTGQYSASLGRAWATYDPTGVVAWIASLPAGVARTTARRTVSGLVGLESPDLAVQLAMLGDNAKERSLAVRDALMSWSDVDPEAAEAWAGALPIGAERDSAIQGLVIGIDRGADFSNCAALLDSVQNEGRRRELAESIAQKCAEKQPELAVSVVLRHAATERRFTDLMQAYATWARHDAVAARDHAGRLSELPAVERERILHFLNLEPAKP